MELWWARWHFNFSLPAITAPEVCNRLSLGSQLAFTFDPAVGLDSEQKVYETKDLFCSFKLFLIMSIQVLWSRHV
jgi:hypothetical protein